MRRNLLALWCLACLPALMHAESVTVFAAASTTDALTQVAKAYEKSAGVTIVLSFGSSATLAKQIDQAAPAEIFLSADARWMDYLAERQRLVAGSRVDLLGNRLVLIAPKAQPFPATMTKDFAIGMAFTGRLALGDPDSVPAGRYAKEALIALGWWDALASRVAPAADVRAGLKLVELGEAGAGIVYATDAKASAKIVTVAEIPATLHQPIRYPASLIGDHNGRATPAAAAFFAHLISQAAADAFSSRGFTVLPAPSPAPATPTP